MATQSEKLHERCRTRDDLGGRKVLVVVTLSEGHTPEKGTWENLGASSNAHMQTTTHDHELKVGVGI